MTNEKHIAEIKAIMGNDLRAFLDSHDFIDSAVWGGDDIYYLDEHFIEVYALDNLYLVLDFHVHGVAEAGKNKTDVFAVSYTDIGEMKKDIRGLKKGFIPIDKPYDIPVFTY